MGKTGSAAAFARRVEGFITHCQQTEEPPTDFLLLEHLGLEGDTLTKYRRGEAGERFREAAERLATFREHYWVLKGLREPKLATFSTYHLKELRGEAQDEGLRLTVVTDGVGEEAFG